MLTTATLDRPETRTVALPTGLLRLKVESSTWPLDDLCAFAARNNPKRGFLIVSRVLGRHLPARPDLMRASARDLAVLVPADLPGPVLVFGLAETAICLGQTVHEELRARIGRHDIFFLHSTRQQIDHPLLCRFEEPHSHASAHLVYRPQVPGFAPPRSLVLVDDEISTGRTLLNLARALTGVWPGVEKIVAASLTDWSDAAWLDEMLRPTRDVALLKGSLSWTPTPEAPARDDFEAAAAALGRMGAHRNHGRLGLRQSDFTPPISTPLAGSPIRIVGTGEFTYQPFLLGERLQRAGRDVVVQATSRSPAPLGVAIASALRFDDNYDAAVPNYLYNAEAGDGRSNWICHETPDGSIDPALVDALSAKLVRWPA